MKKGKNLFMSKVSVSFIIVNYNNASKTDTMLSSMADFVSLERVNKIVVVDNSSSPTELNQLREVCSNFAARIPVQLIESKTNLGYSGGLNLGMLKIDIRESKFVILCNNDLLFDKHFVTALSDFDVPAECHVVFPNVLSSGGVPENPRYIKRVSRKRRFAYDVYYLHYLSAILIDTFLTIARKIKKPQKNNTHHVASECALGVGACMILTEFFFHHYTKLDDRVFLWGEEALLASMVRNAGGLQYYEPSIKVMHNAHSTVSKIQKFEKYKMMQASYRIFRDHL
jgi:GT2 family glycosyltransferase